MHYSARLKSDVLDQKLQGQQVTVNTSQYIPLSGLHPAGEIKETKSVLLSSSCNHTFDHYFLNEN